MDFAGKTVVVTGSGRENGLGQAILAGFAAAGANCVVSDVVIDAAALGVAGGLRAAGARVETIACDVSDAAQCDALVAGAVAAFGGV
ncbi:MAG: SDR family NAD(P)-dependent oxidoreductase, partial [Polymorphobacter sp.]